MREARQKPIFGVNSSDEFLHVVSLRIERCVNCIRHHQNYKGTSKIASGISESVILRTCAIEQTWRESHDPLSSDHELIGFSVLRELLHEVFLRSSRVRIAFRTNDSVGPVNREAKPHYEAIGTSLERRIFRSRVRRGTRWTRLVAAIISSAGSLSKSKDLIERQISSVSGQV